MEKYFNKEKFSNILNEIYKKYPNQRDFAEATGVNRGYLSRYINKKLDAPPTPGILQKIANGSKNITTYEELMDICGYIIPKNSLSNQNNFFTVPIFIAEKNKLVQTKDDVVLPQEINKNNSYFGFRTSNDDMLPLIGKNDVVLIQKTNTYKNGNTCLFSLNNEILIRKIIDFENYIELQKIMQFDKPETIEKSAFERKKFKIFGKVIRVENESAFN